MPAKKKPLTRAERAIAFIEKYVLVPEGKFVGQPLKLEKFQKDFIRAVLDNKVPTKRALLSMARKNAKTTTIAALLLCWVVGPEARRNQQIVSGAMSRDQAAIVFNLASKMVQLSPDLSRLVKIVPSGKRLVGLPLNVEYRALAADGTTAQGLSPRVVILDEVGQVRGPRSDFVDALLTAQGAYDDALVFAISTQAPNDGDLFSQWINDALAGNDPAIVCHLYAAPADCELDDPNAWAAANPALGKFRSTADIAQQAEIAKRMPSAEASFRNLMLNQRVEVFAPFVTKSVWESNAGEPDEGVFDTSPVYLGVDLSARVDLTAIVAVARGSDGTYHVRTHAFTPADGVRERSHRDRAPYDVWVDRGVLLTTPGGSVDPDELARWLLANYGSRDIRTIAYDRWRIDEFVNALRRHGASAELLERMQPFGQGVKDMSPAIDALEAELVNGRMRHGAHPVMTMCAHNARVYKDGGGNRKFEKIKSSGRIDAMVALAMALGCAVSDKVDAGESFFEVW